MQKEGPIVTFIYSAFHKTFDRRFAKFVVNFIRSLRTWKFQYVTVNHRANFESVKIHDSLVPGLVSVAFVIILLS